MTYERMVFFDHRLVATKEAREEDASLRHFSSPIVAGLVLNVLGGAMVLVGLLNFEEAYAALDFPFYFYLGCVAVVGGMVAFFIGLYRLLQGLFAFLAVNTYRVTMPRNETTFLG